VTDPRPRLTAYSRPLTRLTTPQLGALIVVLTAGTIATLLILIEVTG
jgi:hypothetical protein